MGATGVLGVPPTREIFSRCGNEAIAESFTFPVSGKRTSQAPADYALSQWLVGSNKGINPFYNE